jgi:DNA repair exonuclease SbcCD ATPase subunit
MEYEEHMRLHEANAQVARLESERRLQQEYYDRQREEELRRKRYELEQLRNERLQVERRTSEASRFEDREKAIREKLKAKALQDEIDKLEAANKSKEQRDKILLENERAIAKAKAEREKVRMELKLQEEEEEEERKKLIAAAQAKADKKRQQEEEEEKAAIARYEQKKLEEKKKEDAMRAKFKAEEEAKKRKEKEEEEAWILKLKMKKEKEKEEEKEKQKEIEEEMHKKLAVFGFQENQIQAVLNPKKAADLPAGYAPGQPRPARPAIGWSHAPTYIKVSREHLDVETLKYYNLRYEIDGANPNYVIILEEISEDETQMLFEHTRKLRRGSSTLLIEDRGRGRDHQYAFVRKRNPSKSPARNKNRDKSPIRVGLNLF